VRSAGTHTLTLSSADAGIPWSTTKQTKQKTHCFCQVRGSCLSLSGLRSNYLGGFLPSAEWSLRTWIGAQLLVISRLLAGQSLSFSVTLDSHAIGTRATASLALIPVLEYPCFDIPSLPTPKAFFQMHRIHFEAMVPQSRIRGGEGLSMI
jgi:hypothetical protein